MTPNTEQGVTADQVLLVDLLELDEEMARRVYAGLAFTAEVQLLARHRLASTAALEAEVERLKQRLESAEEALDKFGKHDGLCARIGGYGYCNCGLEDALQHQEKQNG